jgi:pyruvate-formate lyase-activating enzyme
VRGWTLDPKSPLSFFVDVVGGCNLRCPSCPMGNSREVLTPSRPMEPDLLERVVEKARSEWPGPLRFDLYNWTEPFLHPRLPDLVRIVRSRGLPCGISTNLHVLKNLDAVLAEGPTAIMVSLSGFDQETYGVTHARGDIEVVKANMRRLGDARREAGVSTVLRVAFHRYLGNHEDEARMREYAESLGYEFGPYWASFYPVEKLVGLFDAEQGVPLTEDDRRIIDRLALPIHDAIDACRAARPRKCHLRAAQVVLTSTAKVMLCCAAFDQAKYGFGSYLEASLEAVQRERYRHPLCEPCMDNGLHQLYAYAIPELDDLALARVRAAHPEAKLDGAVPPPIPREPRSAREIPSRIWGEFVRFHRRMMRTLTGGR